MSKLYLAKSKISNDDTITDVIISLDKVCSLRLSKEKNYYIIIDTVSDDQVYISFENELNMRNELKKILNHMSNDGYMADEINCVIKEDATKEKMDKLKEILKMAVE